jgi:hypothetical protein
VRVPLVGTPERFTRSRSPGSKGERPVLDVVFIAGILALVALVAAVGKGVERL